MEIEWQDVRGNVRRGQVPAAVQFFVDIIGLDDTAKLLLAAGGQNAYFPIQPHGGMVERAVGEEAARKLGREIRGHFKVPLSPRFLARYLRGHGLSAAEIARQLRRDEATARQYLKDDKSNSAAFFAPEASPSTTSETRIVMRSEPPPKDRRAGRGV